MSAHYDSISIIYNPQSSGNARSYAFDLKHELQRYGLDKIVSLHPTKYAGHAERIAYTCAKRTLKPLIISSSGDGGYHDVVNGLLKAQFEGAKPTAGLLPGGNANDHYRNVYNGTQNIIDSIIRVREKRIDILEFKGQSNDRQIVRYAHSYIGFGISSWVGKQLNKAHITWWKEIWIVLRSLFNTRPIRVSVLGKKMKYDSLIFSNVNSMSKVIGLSKTAQVDDGKFEIIGVAYEAWNKIKLFALLVKASTIGLAPQKQQKSFSFILLQATYVQLDGEIISIDARTHCRIKAIHDLLCCLA